MLDLLPPREPSPTQQPQLTHAPAPENEIQEYLRVSTIKFTGRLMTPEQVYSCLANAHPNNIQKSHLLESHRSMTPQSVNNMFSIARKKKDWESTLEKELLAESVKSNGDIHS